MDKSKLFGSDVRVVRPIIDEVHYCQPVFCNLCKWFGRSLGVGSHLVLPAVNVTVDEDKDFKIILDMIWTASIHITLSDIGDWVKFS
jgi:hypothetical protein